MSLRYVNIHLKEGGFDTFFEQLLNLLESLNM